MSLPVTTGYETTRSSLGIFPVLNACCHDNLSGINRWTPQQSRECCRSNHQSLKCRSQLLRTSLQVQAGIRTLLFAALEGPWCSPMSKMSKYMQVHDSRRTIRLERCETTGYRYQTFFHVIFWAKPYNACRAAPATVHYQTHHRAHAIERPEPSFGREWATRQVLDPAIFPQWASLNHSRMWAVRADYLCQRTACDRTSMSHQTRVLKVRL